VGDLDDVSELTTGLGGGSIIVHRPPSAENK
jgi:hypothetical protein